LQRFERAGLVTRAACATDGRRSVLALTDAGRDAFTPLNERQHDDVVALLAPLSTERQERVLDAMATIVEALAPESAAGEIVLREPELGDYGWVIERHGARCGCIFAVHDTDDPTLARLRLLLTEPSARGHGLGRRLVRECIAFAREAGYRKMILWTHSILTAAHAIYASEGFVLTATESNDLWGPHLTSETWELEL
jgi:GNAT superfamily N-acetyltransferase